MSYQPSRFDWPEDFAHENGNYQNVCISCNRIFVGYKRRIKCKACDSEPVPTAPKTYPDEHHE